MKKLLIFAMMLVLIGSMVALESDPSEVVGYVKYDMVIGSNFVSIPMDAGFTSSSQVGDAITGADQISYWNADAQGWSSSPKNAFGIWVSPFTVTGGMPIMVRTTSTTSFYSAGSLYSPEPNYDLVIGTNAVMVPLSESTLTTSALVGNDMSLIDQISYWNADAQGWSSSPKNAFGIWVSPFATDIGMPLLTRATSSFSWPTASETIDRKKDPQININK